MKQLHPTSLYAVELPEGYNTVKVFKNYISIQKKVMGSYNVKTIPIPPGQWIFHFTTATATEQDWATVIPEPYHRNFLDYTQKQGKGYTVYFFDTATDSGHSLLAANGLPIEKNYAILTLKNK